jgi:hypothetical protein
MPFKFHQPRRHRIPIARYRVTNWPEYDRGLVGRGDLRLWIAEEALAAWTAPLRQTRGGQARFSDLAIETVLMLGSLFRLPLRQPEGFVRGLLKPCLPHGGSERERHAATIAARGGWRGRRQLATGVAPSSRPPSLG